MSFEMLDNPLVLSQAFYPRPASRGDGPRGGEPNVFDGVIPAAADVALGYRLYAHLAGGPVILFFHGNGETAPDYDDVSRLYAGRVGASLLVVDYRGYGWSSGQPTFAALLSDTEAVYDKLPVILEGANLLDRPLYVMGRSMGSAPALHIAAAHPDRFRGVIIESGFADVMDLARLWGLPGEIADRLTDPIGNVRKAGALNLPLLVIHGEADRLIPVGHAQRLYDASPAATKRIVRLRGAGHNDLMGRDLTAYFEPIREFVGG
jgi:hypothetical protein